MEREILFRGKRLDGGEWVEGNYYESDMSGCFILQNIQKKTVNARTGVFSMRDVPIPYEVDPSTVGQYTGLTDKNGKKIFDGDIIHYDYEPGNGFWNAVQDSIIEWRPHGLYMDGIMGTNKYSCLCGYICSIPWSSDIVEVIGNRWDNPELLEAKE